jgi:hypothetical protein
MWRTQHYMKHYSTLHYSTYVVHTTTKPKYIQARHTATTRHGCGTAHKVPPLSRPPSVRSPVATPVRPPVATGQPRGPGRWRTASAALCLGPCSRAPPKQTISGTFWDSREFSRSCFRQHSRQKAKYPVLNASPAPLVSGLRALARDFLISI